MKTKPVFDSNREMLTKILVSYTDH